jgi:dihydrolipoamide dehydrogenase
MESASTDFDLTIIGSGPGGYVAAIRGAQAGLRVAIVERENLGGICLNWGCIPTKALLRSAEVFQEASHAEAFGVRVAKPEVDFPAIIARSREVAKTNSAGVAFLMKKNKITVLEGNARLLPHAPGSIPQIELRAPDDSCGTLATKYVILATGASPRHLPQYPIDGTHFLNYRQAMALESQPKSLLVIGSGAIGLELAWFFNALGTQVTLVEALPQILPSEDAEVSRFLTLSLGKQGIKCLAGATLQGIQKQEDGVLAHIFDSKGFLHEIQTEKVLFAVGMAPNTAELGLESAGVILDEKGFIQVDASMHSRAPGIYAIGDCTGKQMLAHKASAEAEAALSGILGNSHPVDYAQIPGCIYCHPQVASIGLTDARAKEQGFATVTGRYPFQASGKARAAGHTEGFIKLVFDQANGKMLGAQILGGDATEMIATMGIALKKEMTWEDLGHMVFAHPTLSEAFAEAALSSHKKAVHL